MIYDDPRALSVCDKHVPGELFYYHGLRITVKETGKRKGSGKMIEKLHSLPLNLTPMNVYQFRHCSWKARPAIQFDVR